MTRRGWILFAAMSFIWGIPYLFIKIAVAELTPASVVPAVRRRAAHARRIAGLGLGFLGVAALVGLDVSAGDIGAVAEVALVALGYALGALIIARKLSGLPLFGVVAASLTLTLVAYAPVGIAQLPSTLPSPQVIFAVAVLGVVCTALAFLLFFPLIAEVGVRVPRSSRTSNPPSRLPSAWRSYTSR